MPDEVLKAIEKAEKRDKQTKLRRKLPLLQKKEQPHLRLGKINLPLKKQLSQLEAEATTVATQAKPTEEATATEAPTTTTPNTATEAPTKPREVNGTVEKANQFTADKPATKEEIDAAKKK